MKIKVFIFILLLSALTFSSCKKAKQNKLTGSWELLPQTAADQDKTVIYKFDVENKLYRTTLSATDSIIDTADYELRSEFTKYYVVIKNLDQYSDANYYIEKLNKKILVLQCQSPYLRKEFTRHEE